MMAAEVHGASSFLAVYHERIQPAERRLPRIVAAVLILTVLAAAGDIYAASSDGLEPVSTADFWRDLASYASGLGALTVCWLVLRLSGLTRPLFGLLHRCAEIVEERRR